MVFKVNLEARLVSASKTRATLRLRGLTGLGPIRAASSWMCALITSGFNLKEKVANT
jgi:hypothetical protein